MNPRLHYLIEQKFGKPVRYSQDCEALSESIYNVTGERLSTTTLKRLFGFTTLVVSPRLSTLDILANYVGLKNADDLSYEVGNTSSESEFVVEQGLSDAVLIKGSNIRVSYHPDRKIEMKYLGDQKFEVQSSVGGKLKSGDILVISNIRVGFELIASKVIRNGINMGVYRGGMKVGVHSIEIID